MSERRGTTSKFYHGDALGSTRGITNSSETVTDTVLYDAFGMTVNRTGTTPTPFGFVGAQQYQSDTDSGLMLVGNRYYDSSVGRFISQDPSQDGDNWYAYCENNPLISVDADGLDAKNNQGLPRENHKLDPNQLENIKNELKTLKDKGSLPADRGRINDLQDKLDKHNKAIGRRGSRQGNHNRPAPPAEPAPAPQPAPEQPNPGRVRQFINDAKSAFRGMKSSLRGVFGGLGELSSPIIIWVDPRKILRPRGLPKEL